MVRFITDTTYSEEEIREIAAEKFMEIVNSGWPKVPDVGKSRVYDMIHDYRANFSDGVQRKLGECLDIMDTRDLMAANLSERGREELVRLTNSFILELSSASTLPCFQPIMSISEAATKPNYGLRLLRLLECPLVEDGKVKQLMALAFEDFVKSRWRRIEPSARLAPIHAKEKEGIKRRVVDLMARTRNPIIQSHLSKAIVFIGFSRDWPNLLLDLAGSLDEGSQAMDYVLVQGVLITLDSLFSELDPSDTVLHLEDFVKILLKVMQRTGELIDTEMDSGAANASFFVLYAESQRLCYSIFYNVCFEDLAVLSEDDKDKWLLEFIKCLDIKYPVSSGDYVAQLVVKLQSAVIQNITLCLKSDVDMLHNMLCLLSHQH